MQAWQVANFHQTQRLYINNLSLRRLCVKSGCYHSEETCSCKQAIRGPGLQELAVAENYFLACFWPLPHASKEASDIILPVDYRSGTKCLWLGSHDWLSDSAYVGHSPSDSVCLCWTQPVGLRMLMLDTIRRTPYAYVGHNPSDSVCLCWTQSVGLWRCTRDARPNRLAATTWSIKTFGGRRSHPRRSGVAPATADPNDFLNMYGPDGCSGIMTLKCFKIILVWHCMRNARPLGGVNHTPQRSGCPTLRLPSATEVPWHVIRLNVCDKKYLHA